MNTENEKAVARRQVPAVTRAFAILRLLSRSPEPIGVSQIARGLELVPSTCLHILRVLQDEGLVDFDRHSKHYSVGIGILPLARAALQRNTFSSVVQPELSALSNRFGVTSIATQLTEPQQMVVVALAQSSIPFSLQVDLGSRFPALISATGRLLAAFNGLPESTLRDAFSQLKWDHPPTFEEWTLQVAEVRALGYAVDPGTYISGLTIVAVPMFGESGGMTRSLVTLGITERLQSGEIPRLAQAMMTIRDTLRTSQIDTGS